MTTPASAKVVLDDDVAATVEVVAVLPSTGVEVVVSVPPAEYQVVVGPPDTVVVVIDVSSDVMVRTRSAALAAAARNELVNGT